MSLINVIKQICDETVKASKPVELINGVVLSVDPILVKIDQRLILSDIHLDNIPELSVGDTVSMLRIQGGKKYFILPCGVTAGGLKIKYDPANENLIVGR